MPRSWRGVSSERGWKNQTNLVHNPVGWAAGRSSFARVDAPRAGGWAIDCGGPETCCREGGWTSGDEVPKASSRSLSDAGWGGGEEVLTAGVGVDTECPSSQGRMMFSISMSRLRWSGAKEIGFTRVPSRSRANDPFSSLIRRMPGSSMVTTSDFADGEEGLSFDSSCSSAFRFLYP